MAHLVLVDPVPRSNADNLTEQPCGGDAAGISMGTYTAGTEIEIRVDVPQQHTPNVRAFISFDDFATRIELARLDIESKGTYNMTVPLPALQTGQAVLQLNHGRYYSCADITVVAGEPFSLNAGINDAWVSASAPFQGFFFTFYESLNILFLAWITFDSEVPAPETLAVFGAPDQRWASGAGEVTRDSVTVNVELTSGGVFNSADPVANQTPGYGTITITFFSCRKAVLSYSFPDLELMGWMTLTRALPHNEPLCEALIAP